MNEKKSKEEDKLFLRKLINKESELTPPIFKRIMLTYSKYMYKKYNMDRSQKSVLDKNINRMVNALSKLSVKYGYNVNENLKFINEGDLGFFSNIVRMLFGAKDDKKGGITLNGKNGKKIHLTKEDIQTYKDSIDYFSQFEDADELINNKEYRNKVHNDIKDTIKMLKNRARR